jgi:putative ATPase
MSLAQLLRPESLDNFVGQKHLLSKNKSLYRLIAKKEVPHMFFYGKPGTGKTSLARIIAKMSDYDFYSFNATALKVEHLREIFKKYENALIKPLVFIDEVHRLSKNQQEILLPVMENYSAIIIGASTENPHYCLTQAILSRSFLFEFKSLENDEMGILTQKAIEKLNCTIEDDAREYLIQSSGGDARALLNLLEFGSKINKDVTYDILKSLRIEVINDAISSSQSHYDLTSAMIKSLRGSDIDASLYYLARLIDGGESVDYITRRLVIFASEDIGNSNPNAINMATSIMISSNKIGYPEAKILLGQCVIYLASSPKSNSSYEAINNALGYIQKESRLEVPENIKDNAVGYKYPHNFGGYVKQKYLEKELKFYQNKSIGFEKTLNDWLEKIKSLD